MKKLLFIVVCFIISAVSVSCSESAQTERLLRYFLDKHVERIKPVQKQFNEAIWATYTADMNFKKLQSIQDKTDSLYLSVDNTPEYYQNLLNNLYDNPSEYEILANIKKSGLIKDPLLKREFEMVFLYYLSIKNNWDEAEKINAELLDKFYELKKKENTFFNSENTGSKDELSSKWINEFSSLTEDFKSMIKAFNNDVKGLGYDNYFQYLMAIKEIDLKLIDSLTLAVDEITREDYLNLMNFCFNGGCKKECILSGQMTMSRYRCAATTMSYPDEWDSIEYSKEEFISCAEKLFKLGNFDISDIYKKSNIWYDKDKVNNSFFFCVDFDNSDFRIYSNFKPSAYSLNPLIHEFAHALHYQSVSKEVPFLLKNPNSIIAEAIGMYFDSKIYTSGKIQSELGLPGLNNNPFYKVFSNPSRVMFIRKILRNINFEKAIFENPDQDFNELWWKLNKEYLYLDPSENEKLPEWMTSFHIVNSSGISVDYLIAVVFAAQLDHYYPDDNFIELKDKIMKYGDSIPWYELIKLSTGEDLNVNYLRKSYSRFPEEKLLSLFWDTKRMNILSSRF
jgi:peptidyl-dipeptidase A